MPCGRAWLSLSPAQHRTRFISPSAFSQRTSFGLSGSFFFFFFFDNLLSASGNEKCGFIFLVLRECQVFCLVLFLTKHLAPAVQCLEAKLPGASLPSVCIWPSRPSVRLSSCPAGPCGCGLLVQPQAQLIPGAGSSGGCSLLQLRGIHVTER